MGKTVMIGVAALLAAAVLALFVAPTFIDWNQYKDRLADAAEETLGRRLTVGGDLSLSLLPLPTLVAQDVRLANVQGGIADAMARVEEVRIRVSLPALLTGAVQVESVRLVSPVVTLERIPGAAPNWVFTARRSAAAAPGRAGGPVPAGAGAPGGATAPIADIPEAAGAGLSLRLDSVKIVDGRVLYRDPAEDIEEEVSAIEADLSAQSLAGPYRGAGRFELRGVPATFSADVGAVSDERPTSLNLDLAVLDEAASLRFSGLLSAAADGRMVRGEVQLRGDRLPVVLGALGLPEPPPALSRAVALDADMVAGEAEATLDNLSLRLGDAEARGAVTLAYGGPVPRVTLDLSASAIDVEKWLKVDAVAPATPAPAAVPAAPDAEEPAAPAPTPAAPSAEAGDAAAGAFTLPTGVEVAADLRAEAVAWRGGVVRQAHLSAELAGGELTLHELTGQLPGNSSVGVFGFVTAGPAGQPQLDMRVEARSDNLRSALDWLGVDLSAVPGGRLTQFEAQASVGGTPATLMVRNLDAQVDTTTLRGAATIVPGARPAFGVTARVGSLNLDAYRPITVPEEAAPPASPPAEVPLETPATEAPASDRTPAQAPAPASAEAPLFAGLEALNGFDANFRLDVETLTWQGVPLRAAHAEGSLVGGRLTVKDTGVGQALGASLSLNGGLGGFGGVPEFHDLSYALSVPDPARLARGFAVDLPVPADVLGAVAARGTLAGTPADLTLDSRTEALGGTLGAKGVLNGLGQGGAQALAYDLALTLAHPDPRRLLQMAAPGYRPRGTLGTLDLTTQVSGQAGVAALSDLTIGVGGETLSGNATVDYSGVRPLVQADLTASRLTLHRFLPAEQQAWLGVPGLVPAAAGAPVQIAAAPAERWSREPLDLSLLRAVDLTAALTADALVYEAYELTDADVQARLEAGTLTVPRLTGRLFGGALDATGTLDATNPQASATTELSLKGFQVGQVLRAFQSGQGASGTGTLSLTATTQGASEADLVSALKGEGSLTVDRLDVDQDAGARGGAQAVLGPILALNRLASLGRAEAGDGTLNSRFSIENGIVRFQRLTLDSNLYGGDFQGMVDLPRWTLDVSGQARLTESLLSGLLGKHLKLPKVVPVAVVGSLDAPRVRVDTGRAGPAPDVSGDDDGASPATPARPRSPEEALPQLLEQMLGGRKQQDPANDDSDQPARQKPEKLMRDLLKGLAN